MSTVKKTLDEMASDRVVWEVPLEVTFEYKCE